MKKLLFIISMIASSVAIGATTYDGESYEYTKANAPSKTVYVTPSNVSSVATKKIDNWWSNRENNGVESTIVGLAQQNIINWATPVEFELSKEEADASYDNPFRIPTGMTFTLIPTNNLDESVEIAVSKPDDNKLRNFDVYLPNEPELRAGLPCGISLSELPEGVKSTYKNNKSFVAKLPAKFTVRQPYSKLVIGEVVDYDDGYDWNPVITNCHAVWNGTALVTEGKHLFEGYNLQAGKSIKVAYPSNGVIVTNDVSTAGDIYKATGWLYGTFFYYTTAFEFVPPAGQTPSTLDGLTVPFTFIYETTAGTEPATWTYTLDLFE